MAPAALPASLTEKLETLDAGASRWHGMADAERAALARAVRGQLSSLDMDWVDDEKKLLGYDPLKPDAAGTKANGMIFLSAVATRLDSFADMLEGKIKGPTGTRQLEGSLIYEMGNLNFPQGKAKLEIYTDPSGDDTEPTSANAPGVGIVLCAGNQSFLSAVDIIEVMFKDKKCVLAKHHPLRPYLKDVFDHIFKPLADIGAYAQCLDSDVSGAHSALVSHKFVTHVHLTGGGQTHDRVHSALVAAGRSEDVLITSELGCVTPWIVHPGVENQGKWQKSAIEHHAAMLAGCFKSSCSMNCLSPKVLVLPPEAVWPQRQEFLAALKQQLGSQVQPPAYYPGAYERYAAFKREYPDAEEIHAPPAQADSLKSPLYPGQSFAPPLSSLLVDVGVIGAADSRPYGIQNEAFAPVLAIATVACNDAKEFPMAAAKAVNEHVFGTLSCNVIWPDAFDGAFDKMVQALNYGAVSVNMWAALGYSDPRSVWGGAVGSYKASAPVSGLGLMGNHCRLAHVRKSVIISTFVNAPVALKPVPDLLSDVLMIVIAKRDRALLRIFGLLFKRCCFWR